MLTQEVKTAYDNFYNHNDIAWRMLGAKCKAQNIVNVCKNIHPKKVLEVGAGDGSILHYLNQWAFADNLFALEIAESGVELIKKRNLNLLKEVQIFDGYTIPYPNNSFDLVILSHVLEHVEHERILIRELKRVAQYIVIEVPKDYRFGVDKRMQHFLNYGHINMYTPTLLRFLLQSEGLQIINDKLTLTQPEITEFNTFINQKQKKTFGKKFKIKLEYYTKKYLGKLLGIQKQEQYANAYTILTQKSDENLHIF